MEVNNGRPCAQLALTGVVAYVEVWSSSRTENYSKVFAQQLLDMGAKVSRTFSKQVTHVIFKEGRVCTWNRAQKAGIKLVSVLWVEKCREIGAYVDEALYPAINTNEGLSPLIKKHRCMQPKDFIDKTPENDRRLQKRLEIIAKDLDVQKAATQADIPVLLFEDDGSLVYSPASKIKYQCSAMERRVKDMKEKRENLSLTASQMSQTSESSSVQAVHEPTLVSTSSMCELSSERKSNEPVNSSFLNMLGNYESKTLKKEATKCIFEIESAADVSMAALGSSPVSRGDCKHFRKKLTLPNSLEGDFLAKKANSEMPSTPKPSSKNDRFTATIGKQLSWADNLNYRIPSDKSIHLEAAEGNNTHLHSGNSSEHLRDLSSVKQTLSPSTIDCASTYGRPRNPRRQSRSKSSTSALCERDSESDFLQAMLTPIVCSRDQDSSYEDYFSPANALKNKIRVSLPFQSLQKLQNPNEVVCSSPSRSKQQAVLQDSSKKVATYSNKRKRMAEISESAASHACTGSTHPQSKKRVTLNYTLSQREKSTTMENYHLNSNIQNKICKANVNGCSPTTGDNSFSVCCVKGSSCEVSHEQKNESNEKLKTTRRIKKPLRTLVMTSMSPEKQNAVVQVVKKLGGFRFSDEVCKNTSHVIVGSPRRTLNVLMGIARSCWIVCYEWVLWSLEYGHWISEEPYELSGDFPAAPICRLQRYLSTKTSNKKLFLDQPTMFISHTSQPPCEKLCELIQLCGGKVCKNPHQAKICIGEYRVGKHAKMQCLSEKWILDSITQHKICSPENYVLQNEV